jgi:hypothetical protein
VRAGANHPPSARGGGKERGLGTILVPILVNQSRPAIVSASPAASRRASLKCLDPPELARITFSVTLAERARRLSEAVKALKRSVPLQPHSDILTLEPALWDRQSLHQNASKTSCFYDLTRIMSSSGNRRVQSPLGLHHFRCIRTNLVERDDMVQSKRGSHPTAQSAFLVNQNRPAIVNASPVASRHAALKGLDPPALARIASVQGPSVLGGQGPQAKRTLTT